MKPILFNAEMVRAILEGRKTVTRRPVKDPYYIDDEKASRVSGLALHKGTNVTRGMPYPDRPYQPGDILWVRETWRVQKAHRFEADACIEYKAGGQTNTIIFPHGGTQSVDRYDFDRFVEKWFHASMPWHPSIHMTREAARLFLWVKSVRVERLQVMSQEDAEQEGCSEKQDPESKFTSSALLIFKDIWDGTIKPADLPRYGWEANPWVWVIEFERISKEAAQKEGGEHDGC